MAVPGTPGGCIPHRFDRFVEPSTVPGRRQAQSAEVRARSWPSSRLKVPGREPPLREAMCLTTYSASRPTPSRTSDTAAYWNCRPTKYSPGAAPTTPRSWIGIPSSSNTGRSIHPKSDRKPVHQITVETSSARPLASSGRPSRTPTVLGTCSTPAAARSFSLTRRSGSAFDTTAGRSLRPTGVPSVSRCVPRNRTTGKTNRAAAGPCRTGIWPEGAPDSEVRCEGRDPRNVMCSGRHHDVVGLETALPGRHQVPVVHRHQLVDRDAGSDGEVESRRVGLEVVGHLVLGRE